MSIFLIYLAVGLCAGILSGLLGLGGGVVIVPMLIVVFSTLGFSMEVLTHMAIGTSLATILATSLSSIYSHHQQKNICWGVLPWLVPGVAVGAIFGAVFATVVSGVMLQIMFGCFLIFMALQMMVVRKSIHEEQQTIAQGQLTGVGVGVGVGAVSAAFGIGGGSLTVPYLSYRGIEMRQAVGSSAVCGAPIALFGTLTYILSGWHSPLLPEGSLGYIYWPAWLGIIIVSTPAARLGAKLAGITNERNLKRLFAVVLLLLGLRFIWVNAVIHLI